MIRKKVKTLYPTAYIKYLFHFHTDRDYFECHELLEEHWKQYDAVIALGTVIRGATSHYDYVCNEVAKGVSHASLSTGTPVIFGVLTTDTIEQAIERAGTKAGNKGWEAAVSAIEMANLLRSFS